MKANHADSIGAKVKRTRKSKKLTLKQLSEKTRLSIGYLSNLERDLCSPTLDNLQTICGVMKISLLSLLAGSSEHKIIIKRNEREVVLDQQESVRYESLNYGDDRLCGLLLTVHPKCYHETNWHHTYDEIGIVLSGSMEIRIEDQTYHLDPGDSFYIKAYTRHSLGNSSDVPCQSFWVKDKLIVT